ncbi:hypothetical protein CQA53_00015 [Helicobacter didelphidarum]|uniref:Uncharacterized protein n=1 Tax=Helicobacter didelphidarum TaxID=2040648 RepID=A0A3D8IS71_9HELI|nr:hypothetical protein [Helicobacter didelphidarum]RDU67454.1 hypothetical protein CQA53_00015 [Helicobacter didelphidarum]
MPIPWIVGAAIVGVIGYGIKKTLEDDAPENNKTSSRDERTSQYKEDKKQRVKNLIKQYRNNFIKSMEDKYQATIEFDKETSRFKLVTCKQSTNLEVIKRQAEKELKVLQQLKKEIAQAKNQAEEQQGEINVFGRIL